MKLIYTLLFALSAGFISLSSAQNISFYADNPNGCAPLIVNFTNTSFIDTSGVTFIWSFNDGSSNVNGYNASHIFISAGSYYVSLTAYSGSNYLGSSNITIYVNGASSSFYMSTGTQACPGQNVQFGTNDMTNWAKWITSDGDTSQGNWFSHTFVNAGVYYITLIENTFCGTDTIIQTITVSDSAISAVQIVVNGGNYFCPGESVYFNDAIPASSYLWDFGDGSFSVASEPLHQFSTEGDYKVILRATNMCGNTNIDSTWVHVQNNISVWANINFWPGDACPGENINFNSGSIGQYHWNFGDGTTSTASNPLHAYADTGTYTVGLIITNACGNSDTAYSTVYINYHPTNPPYAQISFDNFENWNGNQSVDTLFLCPNTLVIFSNNSWSNSSSSNYFWDFGDGSTSTQMNVSHTFIQPGINPVKMIISNDCGASDTAYKWILVDPALLPDAQLHVLPTAICPGETVYFFDDNFKDNSSGNSYSIWFGDGTSQLNITQNMDTILRVLSSHLYANAGSYLYTFTVTNSCGNTDTLSGTITVGPNATPFYYISNSTSNQNGPDWSVPQSATDHQFYIPVHFAQWVSGMSNKFFIAFWYGRIDLNGNPGDPAGMMSMTGLGTAHAYVPVQGDSVSIVGAWSCSGQLGGNGNGPDAMDFLGVFPLQQNGITQIPEPGIQLSGWDGTCDTNQVQNSSAACPGDNVTFMVVGGLSYVWHFGDGTTSSLQNPTHAYALAGTYDATCIVTNGCSHKDTLHTEVAVAGNNIPSSNFYADSYNSCSGTPINFRYEQYSDNSDSYSFLWNFGDGTTSVEKDPVHTFQQGGQFNISLTVTNGCGSTTTSNIYYFGPEVHSIVSDGCAGAGNGFIDLTVNSNQNTSINWSTGAYSEDIFGLSPGNYTVTVTSDNNCQIVSTFIIHQVTILNTLSIVTPISCAGSNDGEISVAASGGVSPYSYLWSTGDDTHIVGGLSSGTYIITIIDAGGCSDITSGSITEPEILVAYHIGTDIACHGANTGQIIETATGGTLPYSYLWSNLQTTSTINNVAAGTYSVTITDAHNCVVLDSVHISQPIAYSFTFNVTQSTCGTSNGSIALSVSGGTPSYTYLWSDAGGQTTSTATALHSGIYHVTVSDNHSCDTVLTVTLNDNNAPTLTSVVNDVLCFGQSNGSIIITSSGGTAPYTYNWSNSSSNDTLHNLSVGSYSVTVTDFAACHVYGVYIVNQPTAITYSHLTTNASSSTAANGSIDLTVSGGVQPYSYSWNNGAVTQDISGLITGHYSVSVSDANGCHVTDTVFVSFANAVEGLSIASAVKIYPNPSTGTLYIENAENMSIEIMNILGNVVLTLKKTSSLNSIDISMFPAGNYFVRISKGEKSIVKKIILK